MQVAQSTPFIGSRAVIGTLQPPARNMLAKVRMSSETVITMHFAMIVHKTAAATGVFYW